VQHLHVDRQYRADEIGQFPGPIDGARELIADIDRATLPSLIQRVDSLVDIGRRMGDDEGGKSSDTAICLLSWRRRLGARRSRIGGDARTRFDQSSAARIYELNAMKNARGGRSRRQARVIEIERVGRDDRFRLQHRAEVVEDLALGTFPFDRGLRSRDRSPQSAMSHGKRSVQRCLRASRW